MTKILISFIAIFMIFGLTGCGKEKYVEPKEDSNTKIQEENNDTIDDEILDWDEDDNQSYVEEKVVVEKNINCDGCVFAYFSGEGEDAKRIGSTLSSDEYTTDVTKLKTGGGKQRHNFFGLVLADNKISRAYACILKDNTVYCIEGSVDGRYFESNIGILNQIFTADQCKYISNGNTYVCTDGDYNGDTITTGYTSLHYETSCTIYGSEARTGELICH